MQFSPNSDENTLLEHVLEGSIGLVNFVFQRLPLEMRQQVNTLIFSGARVVVAIEMTPCPAVVCSVEAHGESLELFRIESPPETQPETTH